MRSVEEQLQAAIALASPLESLDLSLRESLGCVVATDITATYPIPNFDAAAFDGLAVAATSIAGAATGAPVSLQVIDSVSPGYTVDAQVASGQAVRVVTGTLLPNGTDVVIPASEVLSAPAVIDAETNPEYKIPEAQIPAELSSDAPETVKQDAKQGHADVVEETEPTAGSGSEVAEQSPPPKLSRKERKLLKRKHSAGTGEGTGVGPGATSDGEWVSVTTEHESGSGVVSAGSQRTAGSHLLSAGTLLGSRELATVASGGHARVSVHPHPRVVIITVGDELVDTTRALVPGLSYDVVSVMLTAAAEQAGATAFRGGPSRRDVHALARTIADQLVRADLIIVAGEDNSTTTPGEGLVAQALLLAGCQDLEYCALQPGPAIGLGTVGEDQIAVITVGRTALAAFVGFEVLIRPMIAALAGRQSLFRPVVRATLTEDVLGQGAVREFRPASVRLDAQGTRALVSELHEPVDQAALWLGDANALVILPEDAPAKREGDEVAAIRLDRE